MCSLRLESKTHKSSNTTEVNEYSWEQIVSRSAYYTTNCVSKLLVSPELITLIEALAIVVFSASVCSAARERHDTAYDVLQSTQWQLQICVNEWTTWWFLSCHSKNNFQMTRFQLKVSTFLQWQAKCVAMPVDWKYGNGKWQRKNARVNISDWKRKTCKIA